jgi:hypothetical protein
VLPGLPFGVQVPNDCRYGRRLTAATAVMAATARPSMQAASNHGSRSFDAGARPVPASGATGVPSAPGPGVSSPATVSCGVGVFVANGVDGTVVAVFVGVLVTGVAGVPGVCSGVVSGSRWLWNSSVTRRSYTRFAPWLAQGETTKPSLLAPISDTE